MKYKFKTDYETATKGIKNNITESIKKMKRFAMFLFFFKVFTIVLWTLVIIKYLND